MAARNNNARIRKTISALFIDTADVSLAITSNAHGVQIEKSITGVRGSEFIEVRRADEFLGILTATVGEG